jgi:hypothetical protein
VRVTVAPEAQPQLPCYPHLQVLNIWGGTAGNWGRRKVDLDEMEIMVLTRKGAEPGAAPTGGPAAYDDPSVTEGLPRVN